MEPSLPRSRRFAVSERAFRRLALANALGLLVIIASGATVRLTGSGLGCEHWPGCTAGNPLPTQGFHSTVEFTNRLVAGAAIILTLVLLVAAYLAKTTPRWARRSVWGIFLLTLAEAPLGAVTVYYHLNPWLVLSHFLLSIVILTLGVVVAVDAYGIRGAPVPPAIQSITLLVAAACAVLVVTGTIATAAGPHSGSTVVPRVWSLHPALWLHVRATAVFAIGFAIILVWLLRNHNRNLRAALGVLVVLGLQMVVGEVQYRIHPHLPWGLVLVHVSLAGALWAAMVVFTAILMRPSRMA
ncbi:MAG: COX15/CtaA family protein [Actinomycetes bacterium]